MALLFCFNFIFGIIYSNNCGDRLFELYFDSSVDYLLIYDILMIVDNIIRLN